MRLKRPRPEIEKVGAIFQEVPLAVLKAWEAHRPYALRHLKVGEAEGYVLTLLALRRAVRRAVGRELGYFVVGDHLFGHGGADFDPKWDIFPSSSPIGARP